MVDRPHWWHKTTFTQMAHSLPLLSACPVPHSARPLIICWLIPAPLASGCSRRLPVVNWIRQSFRCPSRHPTATLLPNATCFLTASPGDPYLLRSSRWLVRPPQRLPNLLLPAFRFS